MKTDMGSAEPGYRDRWTWPQLYPEAAKAQAGGLRGEIHFTAETGSTLMLHPVFLGLPRGVQRRGYTSTERIKQPALPRGQSKASDGTREQGHGPAGMKSWGIRWRHGR